MPRLYLFAEGATELTFADTMLKLHLAHLGVYLQPPVLIAHAKKGGRVHRGGGRKYLPMKEEIDDGPHTAPSKRIIAELPDYEDAKSAVGPQVAELIGLEVIRGKCPHFAGWLSRLEKLGEGFARD